MRITAAGFVVSHGAFQRHAHDTECELHYFTSVQGRFYNGEQSIPARDSTLVFSFPRQTHHAQAATPQTAMRFYFVRFIADREIAGVMKRYRSELPCDHPADIGLRWTELFEEIRRGWFSQDPLVRSAVHYKLKAFLLDLVLSRRAAGHLFSSATVDRVIAAMRESVYGSLSLERCAVLAGVSKAYLTRLFRRQTGLPPMQYYTRLKMDTARHLLGSTSEPVYMISQRLGFWDEFHFSKVFKKHTGVSPARYRTEHAPAP